MGKTIQAELQNSAWKLFTVGALTILFEQAWCNR